MKLQIVSGNFHRTNDLLKGFTFGHLIVELQKRQFSLNEDRIREILSEHIRRQVIEALQAFDDHIDDIMEVLNASNFNARMKR